MATRTAKGAPLSLGGIVYFSAEDAKAALRAALARALPAGREFVAIPRHGELEAMLFDVVLRHPASAEKVGAGVWQFLLRRNPRNPDASETWIERVDGSRVDFSWHKGVRGTATSPEAELRAAMRAAVQPEIRAFRAAHPAPQTCALCEGAIGDGDAAHVDHVTPFETLARDFTLACHLAPPGQFGRARDVLSPIFRGEDAEYAAAWRAYHARHAALRLVHARCNLTRPRGT